MNLHSHLFVAFLLSVLILSFPGKGRTQHLDWVSGITGNDLQAGDFTLLTSSGSTYSIGRFDQTADFDPGPGVSTLTPWGEDMYIQKLHPDGSLDWVKQVSNNWYIQPRGLVQDDNGDLVITGYFGDSTDFDPGPGVHLEVTQNGDELFVLKLDSNGVFDWVSVTRSLGPSSSIWSEDMVLDDNHNILVSGYYSSQVDVDPGPGSWILDHNSAIPSQNSDCYVWKLDAQGNIVWAAEIAKSNSNTSEIYGIEVDELGNVYSFGYYFGMADFDPGPDSLILHTTGAANFFLHKMDSSGEFLWVKQNQGNGECFARGLTMGPSHELYGLGGYTGRPDMDPGPGISQLPQPPNGAMYVIKFDTSGTFHWARECLSTGYARRDGITTDNEGNVYAVAKMDGVLDLAPGIDLQLDTSVGFDPVVWVLSSSGDLIWGHLFNGPGPVNESFESISAGDSGQFVVTGSVSNNFDFDPSPNTAGIPYVGGQDAFTASYSLSDSCLGFNFGIDSFSVGDCSTPGYISFRPTLGTPPFTWSWSSFPSQTDSFSTFTTSSMETVTVTDAEGCTASRTFGLMRPFSQSGVDVKVLGSTSLLRPGFAGEVFLYALNDGCAPASGNLYLVLDPLLTYQSASPAPSQVNGDTLMWTFNQLTYDSMPFSPVITYLVDPTAQIGQTACLLTYTSSISGDIDTTNNQAQFCSRYWYFSDPNEKRVFPSGKCDDNFIAPNQRLCYMLRFQNTGNAEAVNAYIEDELDASLDPATLRVISTSHDLTLTEMVNSQLVRFFFKDIYLPDSATSLAQSQGYIIFEIDPHPGLPDGTRIENEAGIFFDFNAPVITNTVFNTLSSNIPVPDLGITNLGGILTVAETGASYQWIDCVTNSPIVGETGQSYAPLSSGTYAVEVDNGQCIERSNCIPFVIIGKPEPAEIDAMALFPNPNDGSFKISLEYKGSPTEFRITDLSGKVVSQISLKGPSLSASEIPVQVEMLASGQAEGRLKFVWSPDLPAGIYLLTTDRGHREKLVIRK